MNVILQSFSALQVDSVTVYPDNGDPNQFWYLPGDIHLAKKQDGKYGFSLIKYKPDAQKAGAEGGGFLVCEVNTALDPGLRDRILTEIAKRFDVDSPEKITLSPVAYDSGTIGIVALDVADDKIWNAASPSLFGDNTAVMSMTLSQNQATLIGAAFDGGAKTVLVAYNLQFTAMRPALDVEVHADYKAVANQFKLSFDPEIPLDETGLVKFKLDLDTAIKTLRTNGSLEIKVINSDASNPEADKTREDWALKYVTEQLLKDFFVRKLKDQPDYPPPNSEKNDTAMKQVAQVVEGVGDAAQKAAAGATALNLGTLKVGYYRQDEQGEFSFKYNESRAVKLNHSPQSAIGALIAGVSKEPPYLVEVDLSDDFFKQLKIATVTSRSSFEEVGMTVASTMLAYDKDQRDFQFLPNSDEGTQQQMAIFNMDSKLSRQYRYKTKFNFDGSWEGPVQVEQSEWVTTDETTLVLDPRQVMTFMNVNVTPVSKFSWDGVNAVQVAVTHQTSEATKTFSFTEGSTATQTWKLRVPAPNASFYHYKVSYLLTNGETVDGPSDATNTTALLVPSLDNAISVKMITSGIDWDKVDAIEVSFRHDGTESNPYVFDADNAAPATWSVKIAPGQSREYEWTSTVYPSGGDPITTDWTPNKGSVLMLKSLNPK